MLCLAQCSIKSDEVSKFSLPIPKVLSKDALVYYMGASRIPYIPSTIKGYSTVYLQTNGFVPSVVETLGKQYRDKGRFSINVELSF